MSFNLIPLGEADPEKGFRHIEQFGNCTAS